MTKKDSIMLAGVFKECSTSSNGYVHMPSLVALIAHEFWLRDVTFDVVAFTKSCGVELISIDEARRIAGKEEVRG